MRALDLFCGGGGAALGLMRAGFEVYGVDIRRVTCYPGYFVQGDALRPPFRLKDFDFVWASPPCQAYSVASEVYRKRGKKYPDLVAKVREMLLEAGVPFVIENVYGAPLLPGKTVMLCGAMFGLRVIRHRYFECHGFFCWQPEHPPHRGTVKDGDYVSVAGYATLKKVKGSELERVWGKVRSWAGDVERVEDVWRVAMGVPHIRDRWLIAQAIPPEYAYYIAKQFLANRVKR